MDREQRQHGRGNIVIMKILIIPNALLLSREHFVIVEHKIWPPEKSQQRDDRGGKFIAQCQKINSLAFLFRMFTRVSAIEELAIEQLHGDDSENKLEQYVHDENIDYILQRVNDAIEHGLQLRYALDGFERTQDT